MEIKEFILACYVLSIGLCIAGLTCSALSDLREKTGRSRSMTGFMTGLLVMCCYDMTIYYCNYVIGILNNMEVLRIGNCIIAAAMCLWLVLQSHIIEREALKMMDRMVRHYLILYAAVWFVLTIALNIDSFFALKWPLMATDLILILGFLTVSIARIVYAAVAGEKINAWYMMLVTGLLLWNYISYFWGEVSVYWGNSAFIRAPLDLTIVTWLLIDAVNLIYAYRYIFQPLFTEEPAQPPEEEQPSGPPLQLEERIDEVRQKYRLTPREKEFVELIYRGKSNKEIAEMLFLSESTVKSHIYNIFRKMDVRSRVSVICIVNGEELEQPDTGTREK